MRTLFILFFVFASFNATAINTIVINAKQVAPQLKKIIHCQGSWPYSEVDYFKMDDGHYSVRLMTLDEVKIFDALECQFHSDNLLINDCRYNALDPSDIKAIVMNKVNTTTISGSMMEYHFVNIMEGTRLAFIPSDCEIY